MKNSNGGANKLAACLGEVDGETAVGLYALLTVRLAHGHGTLCFPFLDTFLMYAPPGLKRCPLRVQGLPAIHCCRTLSFSELRTYTAIQHSLFFPCY
jgi:hypothetical protein